MTIASEIQRVQTNIANAYTSLEAKGATMPDTRNSANLASTIDSVPLAEGNTVQAFALGDAKNAVEGSKVSLNFSADIPLGLEDFLVPATWYSNTYIEPRYAAYVDSEYIYYSGPNNRDNIYAYNKETGERTTLLSYSSTTQYFVSQFGLTSSGTSSSDLKQFIAGKMYNLNLPCYSFYANTSDGKIAIVCNSQSYSNAIDYSVLMKDSEGFYSQIVYFTRANKGFPIALLDSEDNVNYPLLCSTGSNIITYNINTATKTLDLVGSISNTTFSNSYYYDYSHLSASLGDITFRFARSSNFTYFKVFRTVKDENGIYNIELLNDLRQQVIDYLTLLGLSDSYYCCGFVGNILCLQNSGRSTGNGNAFIKVDPDVLTITGYDFAPEANMAYAGLYGNGYSIAYHGIEGSNQKYTVGFMQPIEQPYVATSPQTDRFFANQTLTGIVKENNNGVLKVSTVEDPNNPPPAVPDEAGLSVTPFYGTPKKLLNGTASGSLTVSDDASVSGFTTSDSNLVYTDNPFLQILEGSEPVINTFEIVIPFTMGTYDDNWLFTLRSSTSGSGQSIANYFQVNSSDKLNFYSTSSPSLSMVGTTTLTSNTKYWVKFTYDAIEGYKILLSTNGSDYTIEASSATTTLLNVNYKYLIFGNNLTQSSTSYNWSGTIHFDGAYININGRQYWKGSKSDFGSVGIGYGYFHNTLSTPADKYVAYNGGTLTEDNVFGEKATEMNVVLGRSVTEGSWTSTTKGFITTQDAVVEGVNKKLSTPIYLWHDLSYITPAVPETIEPDVISGYGYEVNANVVGTLAGTSENNSSCLVSGFSSSNYITHPYNALRKPGNYFYVYIGFSFMVGGAEQYLLGSSDGKGPVTIRVNSSNQLVVDIFTTDSTTPTYTLTGTTTLTTGPQAYKLRLTYGTGGYVLSLSTDGGSTYTQEAKNTSTTKPYEGSTATMWFGYSSGGSAWQNEISFGETLITCGMAAYNRWEGAKMGGSIGLPVCWANLKSCVQSGQHLMTPSDTVVLYDYPEGLPKKSIGELKGSNYLNGIDLNDIGAISIDTDGIATGFDGSSQLTSGGNATVVDQPQDSFDLYFSFLFTGTVAETDSTTTLCDMGYNAIKIAESGGNYYLRAYVRTVSAEGGYIPGNLEFGQEGTSDEYVTYIPFTYQLSPNTRYWTRLSFSKDSGYSMWASIDGVSYSKLGETADLRLPEEMIYMSCGYQLNSTMGVSAYLNDWYINVDGKEKAWSALGTTNNLYVVKGSSNEFSLALAGGRAYFYNGGYGATYSAFLGTVELYPEGGIKSFTPGE